MTAGLRPPAGRAADRQSIARGQEIFNNKQGPAPATDLPRFRLTCPAGSFLWDANLTTVITNDPAKALITGKCRDIGQTTVPSARSLAAREPYFHDGSAPTIPALIDIYDKRFDIGLTAEEKEDLANFLLAM